MKRQLATLGLASILVVPTWISAAHPIDASAKKATVSKKAKSVTASIKALNSKNATYIKKTLAVKKSYNQLSKKDKKAVGNYATLQKHLKAVNTQIAKVNKLKKDVASLTTKNYKTKVAKVSATYKALSKSATSLVPQTTISTMNYYEALNTTNKRMTKLVALSVADPTDGLISVSDIDKVVNANAILEFLAAYEKLTQNQKLLFGGSQEAIDYLIAIKPLVKAASDFDKSYLKLDPTNASYLKNSYEILNKYKATADVVQPITYIESGNSKTTPLKIASFTSNDAKIKKLETDLANEIGLKNAFEDAVNALPGSLANQYSNIKAAVAAYKAASLTTYAGKKLKGKPIEIADKKIVTEYKKYENIPSVVETLEALPAYDSKWSIDNATTTDLLKNGFTTDNIAFIEKTGLIPLSKTITATDTAIKNYQKLAGEQRDIVLSKLTTNKGYLEDATAITAGLSMTKKYEDALAKNDLGGLLSQFNAYQKAVVNEDRLIRYVSGAKLIAAVPTKYQTQIKNVTTFEETMDNLSTIKFMQKADAEYKVIVKDKPSGVSLVDKAKVKEYGVMQNALEIEKLMPKITAQVSITKAKLTAIQEAIKLYNKLDAPKKAVITNLYPIMSEYVDNEKEIKEAVAINKKYSELKPSKKTYMKDAQTVYNLYIDANSTVKMYITDMEKIEALWKTIQDPLTIIAAFEKRVNEVYTEVYSSTPIDKVTVNNIKSVINSYEQSIKPYPKNNLLLDSDILKEYKKLTPIVTAYNAIFMLKSPVTTDIERENILEAIKLYDKLDTFGKYVIKNEDKMQTKLLILGDESQIKEAKKIDAAYKALKVSDKNYESKVYNVYKSYNQASSDIQKYVINKKVLEEANTRYGAAMKAALDFEVAVKAISKKSAIKDVQALKTQYQYMKSTNPVALQFISADILKTYNSYLDLLFIQDTAQLVYDQRWINGIWVKYDAWFYSYSQAQNHQSDVLNMRKALLLFKDFNVIQLSIINNTPSYTSYSGMLEDNKGNNVPIYNTTTGILEGYKQETGYENVFAKDDVIYNPTQWLNYEQVQNVLDAIAIEEKFAKLSAGSPTYGRDVMEVVNLYNSKGKAVQMYTLIRTQIEAAESKYSAQYTKALDFENAIKAYSPSTGTIKGMETFKAKYNLLDSIGLSIVDKALLKKYADYVAVEQVQNLNLKISTTKSMINSANMIAFIAAYNKLTVDGKQIFSNENSSGMTKINTLVANEKNLKAAYAVDLKYEALDKKNDSFEANVAKLYVEYDKLSISTKQDYSVYDVDFKEFALNYDVNNIFSDKTINPKVTADEFTRLVNNLDSESPYSEVIEVYNLYQYIAVPQLYTTSTKKVVALNFVEKKIITKYLQYDSLAQMGIKLSTVTYPKSTTFSVKDKDAIVAAIALYKKLTRDPKNIADNDITFGNPDATEPTQNKRYLLLAEADMKIAEAADAKFLKIKKGDKTFVKSMIDAMKSYALLTDFQLKFFTQTTTYKTYKTKYGIATSYNGKVDTIPEAIKAIVDFEATVNEADAKQEDIIQSPPGTSISSSEYTQMIKLIVKMDEYYKFLDREFSIEGEKIKLLTIVDSTKIARYKYFMSYYKVQDYLNNLSKK